jgi:CheY-like chemotaxis protein
VSFERLKVLVVDDAEENITLLSRFIMKMGHRVITASNGREAVECFAADIPDLVLMDIMMPEMDGYEATARLRQLYHDHWVPIIFLSALAHDKDLVKGLEVGGDDYLTKPINLVVLQAKINAMQRIARLQKQVAAKAAELEEYYYQAEEEQRIGRHVMEHITNTKGIPDPLVHYWISPAKHFSGDLVLVARTPGDVLHILLADATGHGLAAALNVLPLSEAFRSMTEQGFGITSIAAELNAKIHALMPADRFVSATLVALNTRDRVIEVWNGGNPPVLLVDENGSILRTLKSKQLPLGILDKQAFSASPEILSYDQSCQLFMCSDGLPEAESRSGEQFGQARIASILAQEPPEDRFLRLLSTLDEHLRETSAHDDVSLILVRVPYETKSRISLRAPAVGNLQPVSDQWKVELSLGASELMYLDVVPLLTHLVERIRTAREHVGQLFLIISELFNNAFDHGVLKLDSSLKSTPEGFEAFLQHRAERMAQLTDGRIDIGLERTEIDGHPAVKVHVRDSGPGFAYQPLLSSELGSSSMLHGRGIALVRNLSYKLEYLGNGNEVVAYYVCE